MTAWASVLTPERRRPGDWVPSTAVAVRIASFEPAGLILRRRRRAFTIAYGEILTAERVRSRRGLLLHTRTHDPLRVRCRRDDQLWVEDALRRAGVRVVDCWGAIIAPTLLDFEEELANEPAAVRQSYDNA